MKGVDPVCPPRCGVGNTCEGFHFTYCPWYEQVPCDISECHGAGHWKVRARLVDDVEVVDLLLCNAHYEQVKMPLRGVSIATKPYDPPQFAAGALKITEV